ncbi:hypothetical protein COS31_01895 [Candidatus Roizmanbacteria bacterium CG02_land_8_20_14_3_00_36_15]|uniref:PEGA domain-containing protein n=2 Tax=Candidatus Roizmaniibacteriota TaxID=1752723 RepID=A0A2M8KM23_9BACT|nr:MAG: hypothetical protein COS51_01670 [Candidatus Roizmanbacteria bacterium CG03_land_8_20_14_0_80_36_21]PIV37974.1 MAG: hypothetical protein COS31_01895 [Candidatus Roizmanbacteria bacterium CG02_land_8_20_14_3_00_36_15]PIY69975.1 MAG: hypothetical protein COY89_03605 [Candidatus Roizmanbacteria bacterium CG_4_10_14_0_8_um_filter_36_36]PJA52560.1 MAG: hypothetical protein CO166_05325 [Candidatus Roizmanbacteria bacterium CG_4_9_14_3_um_filter_36_11]PJC81999.1 MAG: hypothetical protein CO007
MKLIFKPLIFLGFVALLSLVIAYGRGYRWNYKQKTLTATGILSINSNPNAGKIYINGQLKGVTDTNLTLPPASYQIDIKKDGYTTWTKSIKLQGELVYTVDAQLFPLNPSLSPLTNLGVVKIIAVDQTERIIIFSDNNDLTKDGIYLFEAAKRPLSLLPPLKLLILKKDLPINDLDFTNTEVFFSPDYKEAIFDFNSGQYNNKAYLLSLDNENKNLFDVTLSKETLLAAWEEERNKEIGKVLETFPKEMAKIASDSSHIISFSPDKTKLLYQAKTNLEIPIIIKPPLIAANQTKENRTLRNNSLFIYDKKEDKNYLISSVDFSIEESENLIQWYQDSKHLVFFDDKKLSVVDYDDVNKQTIYSGPFEKPFFIITTDGNIIVSANLNPETNKLPDLYLVGIK